MSRKISSFLSIFACKSSKSTKKDDEEEAQIPNIDQCEQCDQKNDLAIVKNASFELPALTHRKKTNSLSHQSQEGITLPLNNSNSESINSATREIEKEIEDNISSVPSQLPTMKPADTQLMKTTSSFLSDINDNSGFSYHFDDFLPRQTTPRRPMSSSGPSYLQNDSLLSGAAPDKKSTAIESPPPNTADLPIIDAVTRLAAESEAACLAADKLAAEKLEAQKTAEALAFQNRAAQEVAQRLEAARLSAEQPKKKQEHGGVNFELEAEKFEMEAKNFENEFLNHTSNNPACFSEEEEEENNNNNIMNDNVLSKLKNPPDDEKNKEVNVKTLNNSFEVLDEAWVEACDITDLDVWDCDNHNYNQFRDCTTENCCKLDGKSTNIIEASHDSDTSALFELSHKENHINDADHSWAGDNSQNGPARSSDSSKSDGTKHRLQSYVSISTAAESPN